MKIKTNELIGEPLNYAVAVIEYGEKKVFIDPAPKKKGIWAIPQNGGGKSHFHPSKSWAQGGRLIERERICLLHYQSDEDGQPCEPGWAASIHIERRSYGPTALVAAMRCFVASKVGDEVEIPERLL